MVGAEGYASMRSLIPLILLSAPIAGFAAGQTPAPNGAGLRFFASLAASSVVLATDLDQLLNAKPPANKSSIHHGLFQ